MDFRNPEEMKVAASILNAVFHSLRLRILYELKAGEKNVSALVEAVKEPQAVVSQSLKVLRIEGVVSQRREGVRVYYKIAKPGIYKLLECLEQRDYTLEK